MSKNNPRVIGISGVARSGKDTFCQLLIEKAAKMGIGAVRIALADELKKQIRPTLLEQYGIDVFDCTPEEKERIRPALVQYGKDKRIESKGTYWTGILMEKINDSISNNLELPEIMIVPDIRYEVYENDELQWVKNTMGGVIVHVSRYTLDKDGMPEFVQPPNADELANDPLIQARADWCIKWPTKSKEILAAQYDSLLGSIIHKVLC